jgi:hypothetical protein
MKPKKVSPSKVLTPWYVVKQVGQLGFIIALPLVILIFLGHWLDVKLGFRAFFIFVGIFFALLTSGFAIYQKIKSIN